ncbi:hypothetical protein ACLG6S_16680 [Thermodesulfobacteriota bacterium B35]
MKRLIGEIEMTFDLRLDHWQIQRLYRVRQKVYDLRRQKKRLENAAINKKKLCFFGLQK